ncbi:MAG: ornithine cyclodeaminase [Alphaproteobacteria bacterium]|nr:MAG: ornithine cyclodeaminase [Alphaproteobacteria bacterium]
MRLIDGAEVARRLTMNRAIGIVRDAMIALSNGETRQTLRSIIDMEGGRMFGIMPGTLGPGRTFGAKLLGIFPENADRGLQSHQGLIILFDPDTGVPVAGIDAAEVTAIRTAAASALATDVLARPDATRLAIIGTGEQAHTHARGMAAVRPIADIRIWGRNLAKAEALATTLAAELGVPATAHAGVADTVAGADIICTVSGTHDPVLFSAMVADGTHINLVGSSRAGPREIDDALVRRCRFVADYRAGVLAQGGEFLHARDAGLVDDSHVVGEIGDVLAGRLPGREHAGQVTAYKSLGHVVQDLACGWALYRDAWSGLQFR